MFTSDLRSAHQTLELSSMGQHYGATKRMGLVFMFGPSKHDIGVGDQVKGLIIAKQQPVTGKCKIAVAGDYVTISFFSILLLLPFRIQ